MVFHPSQVLAIIYCVCSVFVSGLSCHVLILQPIFMTMLFLLDIDVDITSLS